MKYCKRCLQPDTRPGVYFDENGVCGACLWEDEKKKIDWKKRKKDLLDIVENAKSKAKGAYDVAIGISGGKDSTFQAFYARDVLKLRPLLVNCIPAEISDIGRHNIENLKNHGFDVIGIDPNRKIQTKLMQKDFWDYLNPIKVLEYPLFASTYIIADKFDIPLIIQGENQALTLGTSGFQDKGGSCLNIVKSNTLKEDPLKEYVGNGVAEKDLELYKVPVEKCAQKGIEGVWLNYYAQEWSQPHNAKFAIERGLWIYPENTNPYEIGTYRRFSQLDGYCVPINQLFKYIKFGFGQATDHVCYDIRDGLITREEGKYLVREFDGRCGKFFIRKMCEYLNIDEKTMFKHAEKFRGNMFEKDKNGNWRLKNPIWEQEPIDADYNAQEIMNRLGC